MAILPEDKRKQDGLPEVALQDAARPTQANETEPTPGDIWSEGNREAIQAYNEFVAGHGVFSNGLRGF